MSAILTLNSEVNELRDRLDAAERSLAHAHRRIDVLVALSQQGRDRIEDELARRLDAVERALAAAPSLDRLRALVAGVDADPSPEVAFPEPQRRDVRGSVVERRTAPPFEIDITPELVAAGERVLG